jgi:hypothetical protein
MANGHIAMKPARRFGLSSTPSTTGKEIVSATFILGSPVINSGGYVAISGTSPQAEIIGIAEHAASGTTSADVRIVPALPGMVFEATLDNASTPGATVSAITDWWDHLGITVDADGIWYVDKAKTTDDTDTSVVITRVYGTIGDTCPQVEFVFLPQVTVWGSART